VLRKATRNKDADVPDVRADEPERAMAQFTEGLRRVLQAGKRDRSPKKPRRKRR
jgi:hypothetical protein